MSEDVKELEKWLIGLLISLGGTEIESTIAVALMRVHNCHEAMAEWAISFRGKEDILCLQAYMSHLYDLTNEIQTSVNAN